MTLAEFREWLKLQVDCPHWYIGEIDGNEPQCIGLSNADEAPIRLAVGGLSNTGYVVKAVSVLVHWGSDADVAEQKAQEVYDALFGVSGVTVGGKRVIMFRMVEPQPVGVGADSEGFYEYVIEVHIYHER